jgi:hypothetical protein
MLVPLDYTEQDHALTLLYFNTLKDALVSDPVSTIPNQQAERGERGDGD